MELKDTVELMNSKDYKERFKAEYWQTKIRYEKLKKLNTRIEAAKATAQGAPDHNCPAGLLREQQHCMGEYLHVLELRAEIEHVDLEDMQDSFNRLVYEHPELFGGMDESQEEKLRKVGDAFQTIMELAWSKPGKGE